MNRRTAAASENAKLSSNSDTQNRDENVDYYTKLDELVKKFANLKDASAKQETLAL
jgi:hypothetical protein